MTRGNLWLLVREGPPKTKKWMRGKSRPGRVTEILPPYKDDKKINAVMHTFLMICTYRIQNGGFSKERPFSKKIAVENFN